MLGFKYNSITSHKFYVPDMLLPDTLKLNEGFHHDLKEKDRAELRGPTFPYKVMKKIYNISTVNMQSTAT